jgi:hypothetical protein
MKWCAYVVLRPGNGRAAPFDGVAAEHECAAGGGRRGPRHAELGHGGICGGLDDSVEGGPIRVLDELSGGGDLELRCGGRAAQYGESDAVEDLGLEVLMEVGIFLHWQGHQI